jgi:hypothetical protein
MDDEPYVSVALDEYVDLINLREFFYLLKDFGIEEWENWNEAVFDFLEEESLPELPY